MKKYFCTYCKREVVEYKVGWYCVGCGTRYEVGEPVLGFFFLDEAKTTGVLKEIE